MADDLLNKFEIITRRENDYRTIHVDGVWGGSSPNNMITCDLYTETTARPERILVSFDENGKALEKQFPEHLRLERTLHVNLVMTPAVARNLANWLLEETNWMENGREKETEEEYGSILVPSAHKLLAS